MSTAISTINGRDLMLFDADGHSYAYAMNHTLSQSVETQTIATKDHGIYGAAEPSSITWEITSENLYTDEYSRFFNDMIEGNEVTVQFGLKLDEGGDLPSEGDIPYWQRDTDEDYYTGKVLITSLELQAQNGEKATMNVTMTGVGKLSLTHDVQPPVNLVMDMSRTNKYRIDADHETLIWEEVVGSQTVMVGTQTGNVVTQGTNYVSLQMETGNVYAIASFLSGYSKVKKVSLDIEISEARPYGITLGEIQRSMTVGRKTYTWDTDFSATSEAITFYSSGTPTNFKLYGITLELQR